MAELLGGLAPGLPADVCGADPRPGRGRPAVRRRDPPDARRPRRARGRRRDLRGPRRGSSGWPCRRRSRPSWRPASTSLEPADRALIRDAAVLGQAFRPAALAAVGGTTIEAIEPTPRSPRRARAPRSRRPMSGTRASGATGSRVARPRGRLRHAVAARPARAPSRGGRLLRGARRPGAGAGPWPATSWRRTGRARRGRADRRWPSGPSRALRAAADRAFALHAPEQALGVPRGSPVGDRRRTPSARSSGSRRRSRPGRGPAGGGRRRTPARRVDWHAARGDHSAQARTTARLGSILAVGYETGESIAVIRSALDELIGDPALHDDPSLVELHGRPRPGLPPRRWAERGDRVGRPGPPGRRAPRPSDGRRRRPGDEGRGAPRGGSDGRGHRAAAGVARPGRGARPGDPGPAGPEQPRGRARRPTIPGRRSRSPTWVWRRRSASGSATVAIRLASNWASAASRSASGIGSSRP